MSVVVSLVYLLVVILPNPGPGRVPFEEIGRTTDAKACEDHAAAWSAKLGSTKVVCLALDTSKIKQQSAEID